MLIMMMDYDYDDAQDVVPSRNTQRGNGIAGKGS